MKKYKFFTFSLFFILHLALSDSPSGQSIAKENEIWMQPLRQCWTYEADNFSQTNIASDNELVFIPLSNGEIEAIHSKTGKVQWNTEFGSKIVSNVLTDKSSIYILTKTQTTDNSKDTKNSSEVSLRSVDTLSGIVNWNIIIPVEDFKVRLFLSENQLMLISGNGNLTLIDTKRGEITHKLKIGKEISSAYIQGGTVILGTIDNKLIFISISTKQLLKELSIPEVPSNIFLNDIDRIFWSDSRGTLRATNIDSGKLLWTKRFGAGISAIIGVPEGLLITSLDSFAYFIDKDSGNILWKRRLAARITEKPFIMGNISILSAFGDRNALFIELKKGKVVNSISLSDANYFTGSPVYIGKLLVFPTLKGLYAFSNECPEK